MIIITLANLLERGDPFESQEGRGSAREREGVICLREWWRDELYVREWEREGSLLRLTGVEVGPFDSRCDAKSGQIGAGSFS